MKYPTLRPPLGALISFFAVLLAVSILAPEPGAVGIGPAPAYAAKGNVGVGFLGIPPAGFQSALINVISVRLNPKTDVGESDLRWVNIPVPQMVGSGSIGKPGVLQFDLNQVQTVPQLFNIATVKANTYQLLEVELDNVNPATLIPPCPSASALEGCINYKVQLASPGSALIVPVQVNVAKHTLSQVLVALTMTIVSAPSAPGGAYTVNVVPTIPNAGEFLATVNGSISGASGATKKKKTRNLAVTAELMGTNTVVASAPVVSGQYVLGLPAAPDLGTLYDLYVSGGRATNAATRLAPLFPGTNTGPAFVVKSGQKIGSITGKITDKCTGKGIPGATVQLLLAPATNSGADCATTPEECVSVATTSTDNTGSYPIPGTVTTPSPFANLPTATTYVMEVSAAGYDTLLTQATPSAKSTNAGSCPSGTGGACSFPLTTQYIVGTLTLGANPPPGTNVMFQVFAEDHLSNTLEGALPAPVTIRSTSSSANFTLNVPTAIARFDLFASAIDLFQGATDPFPGHTIVVLGNVSGANQCPAPATPFVTLGPMDCVGHGSIVGAAANPDTGTTVMLSKDTVELMSASVQALPPAPAPNNTYSFCAPADDYDIQRFEAVTPPPNTVPLAPAAPIAVGTTQAVMIPAASLTSTPCPSTCSNGSDCPGLCTNVVPAAL